MLPLRGTSTTETRPPADHTQFWGRFIFQLTVSSTPLAVVEWRLYD